jgi:hypothetical protein
VFNIARSPYTHAAARRPRCVRIAPFLCFSSISESARSRCCYSSYLPNAPGRLFRFVCFSARGTNDVSTPARSALRARAVASRHTPF